MKSRKALNRVEVKCNELSISIGVTEVYNSKNKIKIIGIDLRWILHFVEYLVTERL